MGLEVEGATMRFNEEQVRQVLQHSDKEVRFAALRYFANSCSNDPAIMLDAIDLLERFGISGAFSHTFPIAELAQSEETITWVVRKLHHLPKSESDFVHHLWRLLCAADPVLVLPHKQAIVSLPRVDRQFVSHLKNRLELFSVPSDKLWARLEEICEDHKDTSDISKMPYVEAEDIAEMLARDDSQCGKMMELLEQEFDPEADTYQTLLEIFLVKMAGFMKYEPAVPALVNKLRIDGEILNEECVTALIRIGSDSVIRSVGDAYSDAPYTFRLYSSGVFGKIHSDLAVSTGLKLLPREHDDEMKVLLLQDLLDQFATEAIEASRSFLIEKDCDSYDLKIGLVVACKAMAYEVPELQRWDTEIARKRRSLKFKDRLPDMFEDFDEDDPSEPRLSRPKVGRNDPCPCGSGKKFKKCCINKTAVRFEL